MSYTTAQAVVFGRTMGCSYKDLAEQHGIPEASCRRMVSEAKAQLKISATDKPTHYIKMFGEEYPLWLPPDAAPMPSATAQEEAVTGQLRRTIGLDRREAKSGPKPRRHLFIPDTQCRPGDNLDHLEWAGRYAAEHEPDVIIMAGDHYDMESLSTFEARGSKYYEGKRYKADIEAGNQGWERFEDGIQKHKRAGYNPRRVYTLGNHEDRITRAVNADPRLEGIVGFHDFVLPREWEQIPFLEPIEIDGIWYAHYWYARNTGRAYSGSIENRLRTIGHSFSQGHQQGLAWGRRELANSTAQLGLVAGSYYSHNEPYRGAQATNEWRGLVLKNEVQNGDYDPSFLSLAYLQRVFS